MPAVLSAWYSQTRNLMHDVLHASNLPKQALSPRLFVIGLVVCGNAVAVIYTSPRSAPFSNAVAPRRL